MNSEKRKSVFFLVYLLFFDFYIYNEEILKFYVEIELG